jgi:hypothetical protein
MLNKKQNGHKSYLRLLLGWHELFHHERRRAMTRIVTLKWLSVTRFFFCKFLFRLLYLRQNRILIQNKRSLIISWGGGELALTVKYGQPILGRNELIGYTDVSSNVVDVLKKSCSNSTNDSGNISVPIEKI